MGILIFAYLYIVPAGKITYKHDFSKKYYNILGGQGFFYKLGPSERVIDKNKIIGDPAYFYLRTSRGFSEAKLRIKYRLSPELEKSDDHINIEAGLLLNKDNWNYDLKPIYNNYLNNLIKESRESESDWTFTLDDSEGIIFFQKKSAPNFTSYTDFLNSGNFSRALFYNYSPNYNFILQDNLVVNSDGSRSYFWNDILTSIKNLRGSHSFYTYITNQPLKFDFIFSNKNGFERSAYPENFAISVYYQNELIFSDKINFSEQDFNYNLNLPNLPEGAYKIDLKLDDQIIIKEIKTGLNKISFLNRVWLDDSAQDFSIYSNKSNFRIKSFNSECLGKLKINGEEFNIDKIFQQFNFATSITGSNGSNYKNLNQIKSDFCGLLIENNGLFSFSDLAFFNPLVNKIEAGVDINNYDYIVAKYRAPGEKNNFYISEIDFPINLAEKTKDGYAFLISAPFLANYQIDKYIEILEVEIIFKGTTLKDKVLSLIKSSK